MGDFPSKCYTLRSLKIRVIYRCFFRPKNIRSQGIFHGHSKHFRNGTILFETLSFKCTLHMYAAKVYLYTYIPIYNMYIYIHNIYVCVYIYL